MAPSRSQERDHILEAVRIMQPGQRATFSRHEFTAAFPSRSIWGHENRGLQGYIDEFLSGIIGSAYGNVRVRVEEGPAGARVVISKHEMEAVDHGDFVFHIDADRQHLFAKSVSPRGETRWLRRGGPTYEDQVSEIIKALRVALQEDVAIAFYLGRHEYAREAIQDAKFRLDKERQGGE